MIDALRHILTTHPSLREQLAARIATSAIVNPDRNYNPVQSLRELWPFLQRYLTSMPWDGLHLPEQSIFRRIDQSIGYFYYIFGSLEQDPILSDWIRRFNVAWAEWLNSPQSWSDDHYQTALSEPRFRLNEALYESPDHWHSWNDFFTRRLAVEPQRLLPCLGNFHAPCHGDLVDSHPIKTTTITSWDDLLVGSPYRDHFRDAEAWHWVLDVHHYHHFHAPVSGVIRDLRVISGMHLAGGNIIWDAAEHRYRYESLYATDFQSLETRGLIVIETISDDPQRTDVHDFYAFIPVGVAQVSSVVFYPTLHIGDSISAGTDLGYFAFGGSDCILLHATR